MINTAFYRYRLLSIPIVIDIASTKNNDKTLLYLGAGAGPVIDLVAQVQVEEDITVLNTSKLQHLFHPRASDNFYVVVFRCCSETDGRKGCWSN